MKKSLPILLFFLSGTIGLYAQKTGDKDHYTFEVQNEEGDLNKDQRKDKVVIEMDIKDETRPLRVQIFLSQPDQKLHLAVSSTQLIESEYPIDKKGKHNGNPLPMLIIEDGNLKMLTDINGQKSCYEFRYHQNNFELIKISRVYWNGKNTTFETEIDLLAQTQLHFEQELGSDEIFNKRTKKIRIASLPKIQDLSFSDLEKY
ncbi:hypothetical protein [Chryseobacterium arthrosphaerae]|uniref:Uncharacterized protein n=1 Tax=Chryseobacterium arthrosphaerae TaxID=651561 RepID=A0A1B8ZSE0_9FLAO|nr:hypothetical protein [Chryseobacterium arthrosphaerae]OCA74499.1 hypothetical protein BBI00_09235 [Chryseobacterium arthrosphaerae]